MELIEDHSSLIFPIFINKLFDVISQKAYFEKSSNNKKIQSELVAIIPPVLYPYFVPHSLGQAGKEVVSKNQWSKRVGRFYFWVFFLQGSL